VLLEAMLSKVPVVASNVHGVREIVRDNVTGWLFKADDAQELSHKIIQAVSDSSARDHIIEKAYELVLAEYNIEQMIDGYKKLYKSVL
ncbi:MAG TPA: glycosyltransferase family 4 protein, partial [bacterium]|nr:glycosyltransferase family 4 protein [bacterium]